jgi:DUF4097 and DUF4098 domain-containing protein YvlB
VTAVNRRTTAALAALTFLPLTACGGGATTTDEVSYSIDQSVTALVIEARAASVVIDAGEGPVTVTEKHRYSDAKPATAHRVDGQTLLLTETSCGKDDVRCDTEFRIRTPSATTAEITAHAGAVKVHGLAGDVHVTTEAGAVEGTSLSGDTVIVKTQAGATSLEFTEAPSTLQATTEVGAVEVHVPGDAAYAVEVDTDVGKSTVSVRKDPASPHRIRISTQVGAVSIEAQP